MVLKILWQTLYFPQGRVSFIAVLPSGLELEAFIRISCCTLLPYIFAIPRLAFQISVLLKKLTFDVSSFFHAMTICDTKVTAKPGHNYMAAFLNRTISIIYIRLILLQQLTHYLISMAWFKAIVTPSRL